MKMKSSTENLRKRGYATSDDIASLKNMSQKQLCDLLHSEYATIRTSAAYNLLSADKMTITELLKQLSCEKCLYTKLAICEALEKTGVLGAVQMIEYLGRIGSNQHKRLPQKVSDKKSFPLPRDIIARALGRMDIAILPLLLDVLNGDDIVKNSEVLDAISFMVFYNSALATQEHADFIISVMDRHKDNELIVWKCLLCLSAFPLEKVKRLLSRYTEMQTILGAEARRSLRILREKM